MTEKGVWWETTVYYMKEILVIVVGTLFMACAVNLIYEPIGMVTGGISGLSIVVKRLTDMLWGRPVPVWLSNLVLNIPIFMAAMRIKGKHYIGKTLMANVLFSAWMLVIPIVLIQQNDYVLAVVVGGVLNGVGLGIIFARGYSTGGTDLLSTVCHHVLPQYTVAQILFVLDSVVIVAGAFLFGIRVAVYATCAVYLSSRIIDRIVEGLRFAKMVLIISEKYQHIGEQVLHGMDRGVTVVDVQGMYTGKAKKALLCVVGKKETHKISKLVTKIDPNSFLIISDIREVYGEGFCSKTTVNSMKILYIFDELNEIKIKYTLCTKPQKFLWQFVLW